MKKSFVDRIKITKTGKMLRRKMSQGHFRAKKRSTQIRRGKHFSSLDSGKKIMEKYQ